MSAIPSTFPRLSSSQLTICKSAVFSNVGEDSNRVASLLAKVEEEFRNSLVSVGVFAERIDDPHLTKVDGRRKGCGIWISGNEFDVLDPTAL